MLVLVLVSEVPDGALAAGSGKGASFEGSRFAAGAASELAMASGGDGVFAMAEGAEASIPDLAETRCTNIVATTAIAAVPMATMTAVDSRNWIVRGTAPAGNWRLSLGGAVAVTVSSGFGDSVGKRLASAAS